MKTVGLMFDLYEAQNIRNILFHKQAIQIFEGSAGKKESGTISIIFFLTRAGL